MKDEPRAKTNNRYIYSARRIDGRVIKTYIGRATSADAAIVHEHRQVIETLSQQGRQRRRRERADAATTEPYLAALAGSMDWWAVLRALLAHCKPTEPYRLDPYCLVPDGICDLELSFMKYLPDQSGFADICRRVDEGDPDALVQFRKFVNESPEILAGLVDLIAIATRQTIDSIAGDSILTREAITLQLRRDTEAFLGGNKRSALDRMQAELLYLFRLDALRCHCAMSRTPDNHSETTFWSALSRRASRRYEKAAKAWVDQHGNTY